MHVLPFFALAGLTAALRRKSTKTSMSGKRSSWKTHFDDYMSTIMETDNPNGINDQCHPYVSEPEGESRGLVILQHGFTACSGFWYLVAPPLVAEGWTVMAPNMPGHGRAPNVESDGGSGYNVTDYTADFPVSGDDYENYAKELMTITSEYRDANPQKEISIVGCSHGGGVAAYMAMRMDAGTVDRVLLMNPFLGPPTGIEDYTPSVLRDIVPLVLPYFSVFVDTVSWGADCDQRRWPTDPRQGGTGSVCQFTLENFAGVLMFSTSVEGEARARAAQFGIFTGGVVDRTVGVAQAVAGLDWSAASGSDPAPVSNLKVQILATELDSGVSNARVHFVAEALREAVVSGNSAFCAFPSELEHTYINPIDKAAGSDLWWLDSSRVQGQKTVVDKLVDFISDVVFVPESGTAQEDTALAGDPACDLTMVTMGLLQRQGESRRRR